MPWLDIQVSEMFQYAVHQLSTIPAAFDAMARYTGQWMFQYTIDQMLAIPAASDALAR